MSLRWVLTISAVVVAVDRGPLPSLGGEGSQPKAKTASNARGVELPAFTADRETAALQFLEQHHAALGEVLSRLKGVNRAEYEQAIRELSHEAEKLSAVAKKDAKLHELMLEQWKVGSRIEVLAARLACAKDKDPALMEALKELLYRQVDLQRQMIEHNHRRGLAMLKVMEDNIKLLQEKRDELVERRFRGLSGIRKVKAPPKEANPANRP
jgi:hypothetical protein